MDDSRFVSCDKGKKESIWNKYINSRNPHNHEIYRTKRAVAKTEVKRAQANFEQNLANNIKKNPKAFWKYVKSKRTVKESIDTLEDSNGIKHSDYKGKASILNQYFTSVFTEENIESIPTIAEKGDLQSTLSDINLNE